MRPAASSAGVSARMKKQRAFDTGAEIALRRRLHRAGLRYRLHPPIVPGTRRRVDLAFISARVAVFLDGCFWHGCREHRNLPAANREWWSAKLEQNRVRDRDTDARLTAAGWAVIRVWEHEDPETAAGRILRTVSERSARAAPPRRPTAPSGSPPPR